EGGKLITYSVNPDTWSDIPLFIRQGAIIPNQDVQQYDEERPVTRIYIDVFPAAKETTFTYYDDDGMTYSYEKGAIYEQQFSASDDGTSVRFESTAPTGTFKPALREYEVRLHGIRARKLTIDSGYTTRSADGQQLQSQNAEGWTLGTDRYGDVTIVKILANTAKHIVATR
ncbi:MAG TPA: DUF5110 domain-containing protein, partial [Candidatus Angelobacter sp.]